MGEAPIVLNIPFRERVDFAVHVGFRIGWQIWAGIPRAAWRAWRNSPQAMISDERFDHVMTHSAYQKFLTPDLTEEDRITFGAYLGDKSACFYKSDFSAIRGVTPYKKMYVAPTLSLIREKEGRREVLAVKIGDIVVDRSHRNAWDITKFFVLQGAAYSMLFTEHPNLHFPFDAINAITKSSVPTDHPIFHLLWPHLRFQLPLNKSVLESKLTVITNWRPTHYAPFTANLDDGLLDFFVAGYRGVQGNNAYPKYSFRKKPRKVHGNYGVFLDSYYKPVLEFTRKVAAKIPPGDEFTKRWATYIAMWIPGFPDGEEIFEGENLAEVLAGIVWDMSVGHAVDHQAFSFDVTVEEKYLRLRVPPPREKSAPAVNPKTVSTWWDRFKAQVAHRAFFQPNTVTRLVHVHYNFKESDLKKAGHDFVSDLYQTEKDLKVPHFIKLEEICASIQY